MDSAMGDGSVVINVKLALDKLKSDKQKVDDILKETGNVAGENMQQHFNQNSEKMKKEAESAQGVIAKNVKVSADSFENLAKAHELAGNKASAASMKYQASKARMNENTLAMKAQKEEISILTEKYGANSAEVARAKTKYTEMSTKQQLLTQETKKLGEGYGSLNPKMATWVDKMNTANNKVKQLADTMGKMGHKATMRFTLPIVGAFGLAAHAASEYQYELQDIRKEVEAQGYTAKQTDAIMSQLSENTLKWSREYGVSTEKINEGMFELVSNGYNVQQSMGMMPQLLKTMTANGDETGASIKLTSSLLEQFGLNVGSNNEVVANGNRIMNEMTEVTHKSALSLGDLQTIAGNAGSAMHALGIPTNEFLAIAGKLKSAGLDASSIGTSMSSMFTKLSVPSKQGAELLKKYNIQVFDSKGKMRDVLDIISDMQQAYGKLNGKQQEQLLYQTVGQENMKTAATLMTAHIDGYRKLSEEVENSNGTVDKYNETMRKTNKFTEEQFKASIHDLSISFGQELLPAITPAIKWATDMVNALGSLDGKTQTLILTGAGFVAAVGPMLSIGTKLLRVYHTINSKGINRVSRLGREKVAYMELTGSVKQLNKALLENIELSSAGSSVSSYSGGIGGSSVGGTRSERYKKKSRFGRKKNVVKEVEMATEEVAQVAGKSGKFAKLGKGSLKVLGTVGKALPFLDILASGTELLGTTKKTVGGHVGAFSGSLGGAAAGGAAGAAIGSVVPVVGTAVGGAVGAGVGALAGTKLGKEIGKFAQNQFEKTFHPKPKKFKDPNVRQALKEYTDLQSQVDNIFFKASLDGAKYTEKDKKQVDKLYSDMLISNQKYISKKEQNSKKDLDLLVKNGQISRTEADQLLQNQKIDDARRLTDVKNATAKLKKINQEHSNNLTKIDQEEKKEKERLLKGYYDKSGHLTKAGEKEKARIEKTYNQIRKNENKRFKKDQEAAEKNMQNQIAKSVAISAGKQKDILEDLSKTTGKITDEQASKIIKSSAKLRDKQISDAEKTYKKTKSSADKKYKDTVAAADKEYYETGTISKAKHDEIVKNAQKEHDSVVGKAKSQKDKVVKQANDTHNKVVKQAEAQRREHKKTIDGETGDILTKWDEFKAGLAHVVNAITGGLNSVWKFFTGKNTGIDPWKPKGYKTGVNNLSSGRLAVVGEEGFELGHHPAHGIFPVGVGGEEMRYLEAGTTILPHAQSKSFLHALSGSKTNSSTLLKNMASGLPHHKNGLGDFFGNVAGSIKDKTMNVVGAVEEKVGDAIDFISKGAKGTWDWVLEHSGVKPLIGNLGNSTFVEFGEDTLQSLGTSALKKIKSLFDNFGGSSPSGKGAGRWKNHVIQALKMNHLPTSEAYVNAWLRQIQSESGGNEKATQHGYTDVNTLSGDLAKGLLQTISATFNAYKFPGHGNIYNGFDNMLAAMGYAKSRYGSDMLGVIGHGHGYANGGKITRPEIALVGESGEDEFIINPSRPTAPALLNEAIRVMYDKQPSFKQYDMSGMNSNKVQARAEQEFIFNEILQVLEEIKNKDYNPEVVLDGYLLNKLLNKRSGKDYDRSTFTRR